MKFSHFVILLRTRDAVAVVSFIPGVLGAFLLSALLSTVSALYVAPVRAAVRS